jgi:hypothetical protein
MRKLLQAALLMAVAGPVVASEGDELTSLSYISYLERYATVQPATQQDSIEAVINMPLAPGDRIDTAREARMEVMLADGNAVWIDEYTTKILDAVAFSRDSNADQTVVFLGEGTIMVEVSTHRLNDEPLRVDGRSSTVYQSMPASTGSRPCRPTSSAWRSGRASARRPPSPVGCSCAPSRRPC